MSQRVASCIYTTDRHNDGGTSTPSLPPTHAASLHLNMHEAQPSNLVPWTRHVTPREVTPRGKTDVCPEHVHVRGRPFGRGPFAVVAFAAGRPETCRCRLLAAASGTVFADPRGNGRPMHYS